MDKVTLLPIGIIHTPYKTDENAPASRKLA